jgi:hypothetical protein
MVMICLLQPDSGEADEGKDRHDDDDETDKVDDAVHENALSG